MNANVHIKPGTLPDVKVFPPTHGRDREFISTEFHCCQGGYVDIHANREDMIAAARHILKELGADDEDPMIMARVLSAKLRDMAKYSPTETTRRVVLEMCDEADKLTS